ncbi:unnamed protein product [Protopolystoma xenopodis]|uniref:Uncharacterized protein n=1 Tax=Protopolystoma xenopodis TaxID=117903 RepID=A0A3S5B408_9PLAT|nr:unnamed protein product [Protopolystoma xenopodis]
MAPAYSLPLPPVFPSLHHGLNIPPPGFLSSGPSTAGLMPSQVHWAQPLHSTPAATITTSPTSAATLTTPNSSVPSTMPGHHTRPLLSTYPLPIPATVAATTTVTTTIAVTSSSPSYSSTSVIAEDSQNQINGRGISNCGEMMNLHSEDQEMGKKYRPLYKK